MRSPTIPRLAGALAAAILCALPPAHALACAAAESYAYVYRPASFSALPKIFKVELNSDHLHAGGPIDIRVTTSPDTVKVEVGCWNRGGELPRTGPGLFTSDSTLPHVPTFFTIGLKLHVIATNAAGASAEVDVPVHYR